MSTLLCLLKLNGFWEEERDVRGDGKRYKYPPALNGHLSHGSAAAQVRQCCSAIVSLSECGTAALGKTSRVGM